MEIRQAREGDRPAIETVVSAAFGPEGDAVIAMVRALDASGATRVSIVADDDGVVGHVQLSRAWVDARRRLVEVLMLTPLAVAPGRQGRGIGTALVAAALEAAEEVGAPAVFLEGDPGYYGARGFSPASSRGFTRPSVRIPEPAFQVATFAGCEDWMTGQVVYPDVMWTTDAVGLRDPRLARVEASLADR
jgi:putative acetyltransferase